MSVHVTEAAAREIDAIICQQELDPTTVCLRVGVKGGGCSGFSYLLDLTEVQKDSDELWEFTYTRKTATADTEKAAEEGGGTTTAVGGEDSFTLRVICDPKSFLYLNETQIDFKDELMGRGFVFNNPNATSSCGCGSSFSA